MTFCIKSLQFIIQKILKSIIFLTMILKSTLIKNCWNPLLNWWLELIYVLHPLRDSEATATHKGSKILYKKIVSPEGWVPFKTCDTINLGNQSLELSILSESKYPKQKLHF